MNEIKDKLIIILEKNEKFVIQSKFEVKFVI